MLQRRAELVLELAAPNRLATGSRARRITRLDHKALDDPMEDVPVVVTVFTVHAKVLHRFGTFLAKQPHVNVAHRRVNNGVVVDFLRTCGKEFVLASILTNKI